jgi:hypothetical protein
MSSSGVTYFVVGYNHDEEKFVLDEMMFEFHFQHDTYDIVEEDWCNLDNNLDMGEDRRSLTIQLKEKLNETN